MGGHKSEIMHTLPNIIKVHLKKWKAQQAQNKLLQPNDYIDSDYVCTMYNGNPINTTATEIKKLDKKLKL